MRTTQQAATVKTPPTRRGILAALLTGPAALASAFRPPPPAEGALPPELAEAIDRFREAWEALDRHSIEHDIPNRTIFPQALKTELARLREENWNAREAAWHAIHDYHDPAPDPDKLNFTHCAVERAGFLYIALDSESDDPTETGDVIRIPVGLVAGMIPAAPADRPDPPPVPPLSGAASWRVDFQAPNDRDLIAVDVKVSGEEWSKELEAELEARSWGSFPLENGGMVAIRTCMNPHLLTVEGTAPAPL